MEIPDTCHIGKRIFKKLFYENARLGVTDKKAFTEDVDLITWQYTLKPTTMSIRPYADDQHEYNEIAIIQVDQKTQRRTGRIAEIIHRAIPYPVILIFVHTPACVISLAYKRFSQAEKDAIVADEFFMTDWMDFSALTDSQEAFLASLSFKSLPHTHFLAFYSAIIDRIITLDCARLTGVYRLEGSADKGSQRKKRLTAHFATRPLQRKDDIANALRMVGVENLWATIEPDSPKREKLIEEMQRFIKRRNQIAHEGDREASRRSAKKLRKIQRTTASDCAAFVRLLVERIEKAFPH